MNHALSSTVALLFGVVVTGCSSPNKVQSQSDAGPGVTSVTSVTSATSATSAPSALASPSASSLAVPSPRRTDTFKTSKGDLHVTPINHASVLLEHAGKAIYVDPTKEGSVEGLPKADVILITDIHFDHLDQAGIDRVKHPGTLIVGPPSVGEKITLGVTLKNGETRDVQGMGVEAVPMYNLQRGPSAGKLFHDKGRGNGYVLTLGDKRVYLSGDTECIDEMKALKNVDVAFVCMNLPYTMPPAEAAACVNAFQPKVVFPYHHRNSNPEELKALVGGQSEVRVRSWY